MTWQRSRLSAGRPTCAARWWRATTADGSSAFRPPTCASITSRHCRRWACTPVASACRNGAWGRDHPALVSIGTRPTFHDQGRLLVEVHLLDYDGDLYGAVLELELLHRLREERRFASAEELVTQMHRDEADARARLGPG